MMKSIKVVVLLLVSVLLIAGTVRPINVSAAVFDKAATISEIRVNGRPIVAPPPMIEDGVVMLPLRAVAEALGLVVEWDATERRSDVGGVYSVWVGTPFISSGGVMTAHKFYTDSYIIDSRTFVSISFFNYVVGGVSAEVNDGIVEVERQSLFWNVTSFPELQLNFWSYNLGFPQHSNPMYEYGTHYDVITHEEGSAWVIWTDATIQNFEFIEVGHGDTGTGMMYFYPGRTLYLIEDFTPARPFSFRSHFGTMPGIAITFLDENGVRLYFTIQQSGRDGSLEIMPFPLDERNLF